jgi:hypothetical protein
VKYFSLKENIDKRLVMWAVIWVPQHANTACPAVKLLEFNDRFWAVEVVT